MEIKVEIKVKYFVEGMDPLCYVAGKSDWIDLHAAETVTLTKGEYRLIPLGVAIEIPEGWEAHVVPRSSAYATWGILQANSYGVIDHSYCGDSDQWYFPAIATRSVVIEKNSRICQFRIERNQPALEFRQVAHLAGPDRGGFGTTGSGAGARPDPGTGAAINAAPTAGAGTVGWDPPEGERRAQGDVQFVLASGSPRRQELLRQIGITDFQVVVPRIEETIPDGVRPHTAVMELASAKAAAVAKQCGEGAVVIAADTLVALGMQPMGKPATEAEALEMLTALQGRQHTVYTGVAVSRTGRDRTSSASARCGFESTDVWFRSATEAELRAYIATGEPMDKAGAYGIQGRGALLVERIDGDYSNVVGLPLNLLRNLLMELGVCLPGEKP